MMPARGPRVHCVRPDESKDSLYPAAAAAAVRPIGVDGSNDPRLPLPAAEAASLVGVDESKYGLPSGFRFMSHGEAECGRVLRFLFPSHLWKNQDRPEWLLNVYFGGPDPPQNMELDWFCEDLKLAVEFNGEPHYRVVPSFHGAGDVGRRHLYGIQQRDARKRSICSARGIALITVRYDCPNIREFLYNHPAILTRLTGDVEV